MVSQKNGVTTTTTTYSDVPFYFSKQMLRNWNTRFQTFSRILKYKSWHSSVWNTCLFCFIQVKYHNLCSFRIIIIVILIFCFKSCVLHYTWRCLDELEPLPDKYCRLQRLTSSYTWWAKGLLKYLHFGLSLLSSVHRDIGSSSKQFQTSQIWPRQNSNSK